MKKFFSIVSTCFLSVMGALGQTDTSAFKKDMQELVISAIKATANTPASYTTLNSKQLRKLYYGADIPTVLQATPSINAYSDNGTGIGYSFFRLRGMDQTRINTTVNGIPVNDPENQGVYFNNFADLASSAENIQVQRGIGTSTNGTSAFGGSVNIQTRNLSEAASANFFTGFGSFGSSRLTAEVQTGLLNKHWMFYARLGQVKTDGYRINSGSLSQSYQFSFGYASPRSLLKFNFFGGNAESQLAYVGLDKATFDANPRSNSFVNNEMDAFKQYFNQVSYTFQISAGQSLNASLYFVKGAAPKFQYLAEGWYTFDALNMLSTPYFISTSGDTVYPGNVMTSYCLDQQNIGGYMNYQLHVAGLDFTTGFHANRFKSDHYMEVNSANVIPAGIKQNHLVYFNTGYKNELSAFAKASYTLPIRLVVFGDIQVRSTQFKYQGKDLEFRKEYGKVEDMNWLFVNPKLGIKFGLNQTFKLYALAGFSMREPTRFDYLQDDFAVRDVKQNEIKPEQVIDIELGTEIHGFVQGKVNLFIMEFQNQIVATGALNNFGYAITGNVGRSHRRGIEADLSTRINNHFSAWLSSSISDNRIDKLDQTYFNTDIGSDQTITYGNTILALSPSQIHHIGIESNWFKKYLLLGASFRYVSMQYLDNSHNKNLSLPAFQTLDVQMGFNAQKLARYGMPNVSIKINNLLNAKYAPSGSLGGFNSIDNNGNRGQQALYFPAASTNLFCTLSWYF